MDLLGIFKETTNHWGVMTTKIDSQKGQFVADSICQVIHVFSEELHCMPSNTCHAGYIASLSILILQYIAVYV